MRIAYDEKELEVAWQYCRMEAKAAFGDESLYIEKYIEEPRHIEIQVIGDKHGNYFHLGERECSIQRRHQKLVEEAPSPAVTPKLRKRMGEAAIRLCKSVKYFSAGTVEFLVDSHGNFYFIEMNTRIQVEHPVTEENTGLDIVALQIMIAQGEKIKMDNFEPEDTHAIECRINAEDPYRGFVPSPGLIEKCILPGGPGIRVDTHIYQGYRIPPHYDSLIAKIIARGRNRMEAIQRMLRALMETTIEGPGVRTTIPFHIELLSHPDFIKGNISTNFLAKINLHVGEGRNAIPAS